MRAYLSLTTLLLLLAANALSQTQAINGSVRGRVLDQAGSPIAGARVEAVNDGTGFTRSQETQEDGYYVIANLPLGSYTVSIQKNGFASERHTSVVLDAGTTASIDAQLKVGEVSTSIEVTGGAPVVEPDRVSTGRTITNIETDNLPLTSRNPYNFILFQPGVSGHPNPELGIPRLLNTNGLVDHVNYQLDGTTDTESDRTGLRLFAIADNYVSEVQVVSNSFSPEFGRIAGNIYNVITQSGSNQFHGEVQYLGRPLDLVARPILATPTTLKPIANDFFGNAGGKIIKDKLFFFASYERVNRSVPSPTTITAANAAAIGLSPSLLVNPPAIEHAQWVDARLDWSITQKHQFFIRYNYFRNRYPFNTNDGGLYALNAASDFRDRAHVAGAQLLSTFSPTVLNELALRLALSQRAAHCRSAHRNRSGDHHQRHRQFRRQHRRRRSFSGEDPQPQRQLHRRQRCTHPEGRLRLPAKSGYAGGRYLHAIHFPNHRRVSVRAVRRKSIRLQHLQCQRRRTWRLVSLILLGFLRAG